MNNSIQFYSTNLQAPKVSFKEALLKGLAPDKGLYMPESIPQFSKQEIEELKNLSYPEIAFKVSNKFLNAEISESKLKEIVKDAYNFDVPLEKVYNRNYILRLDQGPTASFKDFAARMMGRLMQYYLNLENREMLILTATSGDTGSAIANAFYGLDNIKVVILFPTDEVTDRQRRQMTTLNKNVQIIGLDAKFDDCQAMVKQAFADKELDNLKLSSANSINIGRLLPQSMYYFYSYSRLANNYSDEVIFSVPSGNFGDLMGGIIAKHMGLPVKKFIVATNENKEVPVYLDSGVYKTIVPSINCISSAMNVGHPSNMSRIIALYGGQMDEKGNLLKRPDENRLRNDLHGISVSDETTRETIKNVYNNYQVMLEPHGAVAWYGAQKYLADNKIDDNQLTITLETAHPAKFPAEVKSLLGKEPELPESLQGLDDKGEFMVEMRNDYSAFKEFLIKNYK